MGNNAGLVLLAAACASSLYAAFLNRIHHLYAPDHIWITVVGGNALIGGLFAWWLGLDPLPAGATFAPFWRLLALNIAAGIPVIAWQFGQAHAREVQRRPRGGSHGSNDAGRPRAD